MMPRREPSFRRSHPILDFTNDEIQDSENFSRFGLGMKVSTPEQFLKSSRLVVRGGQRGMRPPRRLLLDYLPPVGNQGNQGSCVGWSTAYYAYTYGIAKQRRLDQNRLAEGKFQFSPAFIYNQINHGEDKGSYIFDAFEILKKKGCATLDRMPYHENDFTSQPNNSALSRAELFKSPEVGCLVQNNNTNLSKLEDMKTFLAVANNPLVAAINVHEDFFQIPVTPGFVYERRNDSAFKGRHAVAIVGYDDSLGAFRMVNSWGSRWGEGGFAWLGERFVLNHLTEAWAFVPGGLTARTFSRNASPEIRLEPPQRR